MSSTYVDPLSIQEIIDRISNLKKLASDCAAKADQPQQPEKTEVLHELGKLCKELDYMISSFQKLDKFENSLREPLRTLETNVNHIVTALEEDKLPKQVQHNLRVLRNNITRVKILIPAQHQTVSFNSEGNPALLTTIGAGDDEDLPRLFGEAIFEKSYYFKEIEEKYKGLDVEHRLRLLCFAMFPENVEIKKRFLRFWWVGENLISAKDGMDEKRIVNDTLNTYVEKGLIEPVLKKNKLQPRSYKVNPIVRSCLIKFAKDAGFFAFDPEGKPTMDFSSCNKACMVRSERAIEEQQGQENLSVYLERLQMFFNFPDKDALIKASQQIDKLQTLLNLSKQFPALPAKWLLKMTGLKVLYLGKWESAGAPVRYIELEEDFLKGLKNMKNLRLLSLQGISGIRKVPGDLCKLENLRILDLRACYGLEKLPDGIGSLKKLTYLDLSECYLFDYMPKQLSQLAELQVLKGFVIVDVKNSCTLRDLSKLKNLRKLSINVKTTKFDIDAEEEALSRLQSLEKLKIAWRPGGIPRKEDSTRYSSTGSQRQSKSKKKQASSSGSAAKILTEKKKGEDEANSKTTKQEDNKNRNDSLQRAANMVLAANKFKSLAKRRKQQDDLKGLENLVKLDLQCFPHSTPPRWLVPSKMVSLTNLSIRGGRLRYLVHEYEQKWNVEYEKWNVNTLRLKFLMDFTMNWKEMRERFPKLVYLDIFRSPRITLCPCDVNGVWRTSSK